MTILYPIDEQRLKAVEPVRPIGMTKTGGVLLEDRSGNRFSISYDALVDIEQMDGLRSIERDIDEAVVEAVEEALKEEEPVAGRSPKEEEPAAGRSPKKVDPRLAPRKKVKPAARRARTKKATK